MNFSTVREREHLCNVSVLCQRCANAYGMRKRHRGWGRALTLAHLQLLA